LIAVPPAAIIATTATATATASSTTATGTLFARFGNVDCEIAAVNGSAIQSFDGFFRFLVAAHGDEAEAARTSAHAVHHQVGFHDGAVRGEHVAQVVFCGVEGKISYKQFGITHVIYFVLDL